MTWPRAAGQRCPRRACLLADLHDVDAHNDPRSDHYDGLSAVLATVTHRCRGEARQLARAAVNDSWNVRLVNIVVHELAAENRRLTALIAEIRNTEASTR